MERKRTKKEEKEFQEQLKRDQRKSHIHFRYQLVRDALFLINQATHRLQDSWQYFDCSQNPDFDDLHHNIHQAESFIEFANEKLMKIMDRDYELNAHPQQTYEQYVEETKKIKRNTE
jgi:hypothetical protein